MMKTSVAVIALVYGVEAARLYSQSVSQLNQEPVSTTVTPTDKLAAAIAAEDALAAEGAV